MKLQKSLTGKKVLNNRQGEASQNTAFRLYGSFVFRAAREVLVYRKDY